MGYPSPADKTHWHCHWIIIVVFYLIVRTAK